MTNPIEWKEADRVETTRVPGASARLVVRRQHFAGRMTTQDATPADLAAALDAIPAGERAAVLQAFGSDPEMRAALLADCAVAYGKVAAAEAARDAARKELSAVQAERDAARADRDTTVDRAERFAATAEEWRHETIKVQAERDALRTELRAREWLDEQGVAVIVTPGFIFGTPGFIFVGIDGVAFAYASYASAARALGWEG